MKSLANISSPTWRKRCRVTELPKQRQNIHKLIYDFAIFTCSGCPLIIIDPVSAYDVMHPWISHAWENWLHRASGCHWRRLRLLSWLRGSNVIEPTQIFERRQHTILSSTIISIKIYFIFILKWMDHTIIFIKIKK